MDKKSALTQAAHLVEILDKSIAENSFDERYITSQQKELNKIINASQDKSIEFAQMICEAQALLCGMAGNSEQSDYYVQNALNFAGGSEGLKSEIIKNELYSTTAAYGHTPPSNELWYKKLLGGAASLVAIVIVYGLINAVLVGGQKAVHHGDQAKLDDLKAQLASEKNNLDSLSSTIDSEETDLSQSKQQMDSYKTNGQVAAYNNMVDPYNAKLDQYKSDINTYNSQVGTYNSQAVEANKLAKSIGSTWVVVPVPAGRHSE